MSREILHESIQTLSGFFLISWLQYSKKLESLGVSNITYTSIFLDKVQLRLLSTLETTLAKKNNAKMVLTESRNNSVCFARDLTLHVIVMLSQIIRSDLTLSKTVHCAWIVLLTTVPIQVSLQEVQEETPHQPLQ